jgi:uncharacterized membrane protein ArfB
MAFVIEWFWCVLGFLAGSAVGWAGVMVAIKRTVNEEAPADASPETGALW